MIKYLTLWQNLVFNLSNNMSTWIEITVILGFNRLQFYIFKEILTFKYNSTANDVCL